jgi:UDP-N-acetylmuramoyl-tripeptide--D-alanyl-D-alanine ligase
MTIESIYAIFLAHPSIVTDTRKLQQGDIFVALKGPNFNGNLYAEKAFCMGAAYCICDEEAAYKNEKIILVDDALQTLQALAKYHRQKFHIPFIGITGSNGKTTTKELIHAVLSKKYTCTTTVGNLNNHIGVPLTLLTVTAKTEIAIIEMGANHLHEIASYCEYAMPTYGLITNCGKAHLEGFGSEAGVKKGKGELYDYIKKTKGTLFVNTDYAYLNEMAVGIDKIISYGTSNATYVGIEKESTDFLAVEIKNGAAIGCIQTQLAGNYNVPNVMSAVCIGKTFEVADADIKNALEEYTPTNSRSQIIKKDSNTILLDAYNANPSSMKVAIENFAKMQGENKIVVLGGMKELGNDSVQEHTAIIHLLQKYTWQKVILAGEDYTNIPDGFLHFNTSDEVAVWFKTQDWVNTTMLIKGSRGMAMEKILD